MSDFNMVNNLQEYMAQSSGNGAGVDRDDVADLESHLREMGITV